MSSAARERLALAQAELLRALSGQGEAPRGFDAAGVAEEARTLASKRLRQAAKSRPALVRAIGRSFVEHFASYARAHANPGHPGADALAFARWFDDQLERDDVLESLAWRVGLKAVAGQARGAKLTPDERADLEQLQAFLAAVTKRRGPGALEEPRLKVALTVGSLLARGLELDREQVATLRGELTAALETLDDEPGSRLLNAALAALEWHLEVERAVARVLRPEQRERYEALAKLDPLAGASLPRLTVRAPTRDDLVETLASAWTRAFALGETARASLRTIAASYVASVARADDDSHENGSRWIGALERATAVLDAQMQAERALCRIATLSPDERGRIASSCGSFVLDVSIPSI